MDIHNICLVDAYALIYRAYYAFIRSPRINSKGVNTSAPLGFLNSLIDLLSHQHPDYIAVAFDPHGKTFRHELYPEYKANRQSQPEDITAAVPIIHRLLDAMRIRTIECPRYEADDIIGTVATSFATDEANMITMLTPDKDYAQLVCANVHMLRPSSHGLELWDTADVCSHYQLDDPRQVIDMLALWGDASDNIPGCPGVGEKTAISLLQSYNDIDGIYANLDKLKGKLRQNLETYRDQVYLSQRLTTIVTDAPVSVTLEDIKLQEPDYDKLRSLCDELEFRNIMPRVRACFNASSSSQPSLFDLPKDDKSSAPTEPNYDTAATTPHEYTVVSSDQELNALLTELLASPCFCFDTETTSLNTYEAEIVGLSIAMKPHRAYYIPFDANTEEARRRLSILAPAFQSDTIVKVAQNLKYDLSILSRYGIEIHSPCFDTMIAHSLLFPSARHNMDDMARSLLNYQPIEIECLIGKGQSQISMRDVPLSQIKEYAAEDADVTLRLYLYILPLLEADASLMTLFRDIEMPLVPVLSEMELSGVQLDTSALNDYAADLKLRIDQCANAIYAIAGRQFNIASPRQVGQVLFEELHLDPNARPTHSGSYRTDEETLQKLAADNPIVAQILEYRGLKKLLGTYAETLPQLVDAGGRVHTSYNQTVVITGRLSSTNPNLQNIPVRTHDGRQIRRSFVARDCEHRLLAADYSQVELRLMAHFSQDPNLIAAFQRGDDIHAATAARIYGVDISDVTADMRRRAKTANFGIIYGISAFGLAERLAIPRSEARDIIEGYFSNFHAVKAYMDECIDRARKTQSVSTLFGRIRPLPDINSRNATVRAVAERNAINTPIQGTAADIIKIAMIRIHAELRSRGMRSVMTLQVHDELVFDAPSVELDELRSIVKDKMETACQLSVPLVADIGVGRNWVEAH